jgi:hypothetical protein
VGSSHSAPSIGPSPSLLRAPQPLAAGRLLQAAALPTANATACSAKGFAGPIAVGSGLVGSVSIPFAGVTAHSIATGTCTDPSTGLLVDTQSGSANPRVAALVIVDAGMRCVWECHHHRRLVPPPLAACPRAAASW